MKTVVAAGLGLVVSALVLAGCGGASMGPKVRVATATAAELKAVEDQDNVWYEFQPGDVIPVQLGFLGAIEGGAREPAVFRAKQRFYFVMFKNQPMQISFDGETFAAPDRSQQLIAVVPRSDGNGGQLGWVIYMGESGDPKAELLKLIESSSGDSDSEAASAPSE
jgi:hypothetical protein